MTSIRPVSSTSRVERLKSVDGMIVYDLAGAEFSGGGTRVAPDVSCEELALLARAMTFKIATLGVRGGSGAKIGIRCQRAERDDVMRRFRAEIAPLLASGRLMTGPDLGTSEADFTGLPTPGNSWVAQTKIGGFPAEEVLTGIGVATAAEAALGDPGALDGRSVALEGFGKMGASIARALAGSGARIVAVSTVEGCAGAPRSTGFPVEQLLEARIRYGDDLIAHLGTATLDRSAIWSTEADVVIPGARAGVIDAEVARRIAARHVVPVANAPYTQAGLRVLAERGIPAHADFVCGSGGAMAYVLPDVAHAPTPDRACEALRRTMRGLVQQAMEGYEVPYVAAVQSARRFLAGWCGGSVRSLEPPLASDT